ncbi:hypothetical protein ABKV19_007850 [Rosa sericea]
MMMNELGKMYQKINNNNNKKRIRLSILNLLMSMFKVLKTLQSLSYTLLKDNLHHLWLSSAFSLQDCTTGFRLE